MKRALVIAVLVAVAVPLMLAMAELPPYGSPDAPGHLHVAPYYLEHAEETGAKNVVSAIILDYRGFDTQGEVTVIFTAMAAVVAVLLLGGTGGTASAPAAAVPVSVIVRFIVRVMAPFILLFSAYVIVNGHFTPGGGFPGGTITGALVIALTLVMSEEDARRLTPTRPERLLQAAAPITFFVVGLAGLALTGDYLAYPHYGETAWLALLMLTIVAFGIGVGGAMVIATIFRMMRADR